MLNSKKMAMKWQKAAAIDRRSISLSKTRSAASGPDDRVTSAVCKGHVVVYSVDGNRFVVPVRYLKSSIFRELFKLAEEEFGLPRDGPITLPCDAAFMEDVVFLLGRKKRVPEDVARALVTSINGRSGYSGSSSSIQQGHGHGQHQQLVLCTF